MNNEDFLQIFPSTNAGRKKIELRHTYGTLELDVTFKCIQHIGTLGLKWVVNFTMPSKVTLEKHGKSVNNIPDPESGKLSGSFGTRFLLSHAWFPGTCTDLLQLDKWWNYQHLSRYIWITIYIYIYQDMVVSWNRGTPKSSILYNWIFNYKPTIFGYPRISGYDLPAFIGSHPPKPCLTQPRTGAARGRRVRCEGAKGPRSDSSQRGSA